MPTYGKSALITIVRGIVTGQGQIGTFTPQEADYNECLDEALAGQYSQFRRRVKPEDYTSTGATLYLLDGETPILDDWEVEFSRIVHLEYPIYDPSVTERAFLIEGTHFVVIEKPAGWYLQFLAGAQVPAGEDFRTYYTIPRQFNSSKDVVMPLADKGPYCNLSASLVFKRMATLHAEDTNSNISADTHDTQQIHQRFLDLSSDYFKLWEAYTKKAKPKKVRVLNLTR